jgi:hypothetical protein
VREVDAFTSPSVSGIVHGWKVIENKRGGMQVFDATRDRARAFLKQSHFDSNHVGNDGPRHGTRSGKKVFQGGTKSWLYFIERSHAVGIALSQ